MRLARSIACLALAVIPYGSAGTARATEGAIRPAAGVVLFLSYHRSVRPGFEASTLHDECWDSLSMKLQDMGRATVSRADLDASVRAWRVRTDLAVSPGFLREIAANHGVEDLLVFTLALYRDRALACARSVGTSGGVVTWADVEEVSLPRSSAGADTGGVTAGVLHREAALRAGQRLLERWSRRDEPEARRADLFLLPVRVGGLEPLTGTLAMACLLRDLARSTWFPEDPGVTFCRLREAGHDPRMLSPQARPAVAGPGSPGQVVICQMISEARSPAAGLTQIIESETSGLTDAPYAAALSLRIVDAETGTVRFAGIEVLEPPSARGLFGLARHVSMTERVQGAAEQLLRAARQKG